MSGIRTLTLPLILLVGWALLSAPGGLTGFDLVAGVFATGAGVLLGVAAPRLASLAERSLAVADDLLGDGPRGRERGRDVDSEDPGDPEALDPDAAPDALEALLDALADEVGATRLAVWTLERHADTLSPDHVLGTPLRRIRAAGSPLTWAAAERSPLRLDPTPGWAVGAVVVAPIDDDRVLTVETDVGTSPDLERVAGIARLLAPALALHDQQAHARAATARVERVVELLRAVPLETEPGRMADGLARVGLELTGADGALVASWTGEEGVVLAREGEGGGPETGSTFGVMDGDLAHAARTSAAVHRAPGEPRPDLATGDERWARPAPPYRSVLPLVDASGATRGLVALWGRSQPAEQGVALIGALGPLLALQLSQAGDLVRYREQAIADALTGLANRASLDERMAEEQRRFDRYRRPAALLVIDLDHFKRINDTHGHDAGDAVLRHVADVIRAGIRDVDFAARFGGEELVVLLPETMLRAALDVAERVRATIAAAPVPVPGGSAHVAGDSVHVTASIGVSACPECVDDPAGLFASADQALYAAKEAGRNRVTAADRPEVPAR